MPDAPVFQLYIESPHDFDRAEITRTMDPRESIAERTSTLLAAALITGATRCPNDTDGDGDCHVCARIGGCVVNEILGRPKNTVAAISVDDVVKRAEFAARSIHGTQKRRDGSPYITHLERVFVSLRNQGASPRVLAAAWLHDSIEDHVNRSELLMLWRIPEDVVQLVEAVSRRGKEAGETYADFIERVVGNPDAVQLKIADVIDNLSDTPSAGQVKRYARALRRLLGLSVKPVAYGEGETEWRGAEL